MKTFLTLLIGILFVTNIIGAQESKVEIVPDSLFHAPKKNETHRVLICSYQGIPVEMVSSDYFLPFNVFEFSSEGENWWDIESVYNTIRTKVPSVSITSSPYLDSKPIIRMRGDDNTIVIVDGVRYDTSILNTINPADIENMKVATGAAANNYFINN